MNESLRRVVNNFSWLLFEKVLKMAVGLVITIQITRQLGVETFGTYSYIIALAAIFAPLASVGLETVTIRELIKRPERAHSILGSALMVRLFGGILVLIFASLISWFWVKNGRELVGLILLVASSYFFQAFDVIDYYFQSQQKMKRSVVARMSAFLLVNALKFVALLHHAHYQVFIFLFQLEFIFCLIFYVLNYGKEVRQWKVDLSVVKSLLKDSWPALIIGLSISVQGYFDQIILGSKIGVSELSQYTVAMTIVSALNFAPMIVYMATSPEIIKAREMSTDLYHEKLKKVYRSMFILFILMALPLMLFSNQIIHLLYGDAYEKAGVFLALFSLRLLFVNIGTAKQAYVVAENLYKFQMFSALIGAFLNVCLNFLLIPRFASIGAFISIIVSYLFSVFLNDFFNERMRLNLNLIFSSIWPLKSKR